MVELPHVPLIHIHEDDWAMRNLYPTTAWNDVVCDLAKATKLGERSQAPDGARWTDWHLAQIPRNPFRETGLTVAHVKAALQPLLPFVKRFRASSTAYFDPANHTSDPYGSDNKDAVCFGFDHSCFIKIERKFDTVAAIWFDRMGADGTRLAALRSGVEAIDALVPLVIADYHLDAIGAVRDTAFMDAYFVEDPSDW